MGSNNISEKWGILSGKTNWEGMLEPLDIDLRKYLLHYGEMTQAVADTLIVEPKSKNVGASRFSKKDFFSKVGLGIANHPYKYTVTNFFYASSGKDVEYASELKSVSENNSKSKQCNLIGYIAVADDEAVALLGRRDIVIVWRGTLTDTEEDSDFKCIPVPASHILGKDEDGGDPHVHQGWYSMYTKPDPQSPFNTNSARDQVKSELQSLLEKYKNEETSITITGHSMGAALATLNAVDIVTNKLNISPNNKSISVTVFAYASPRIGNLSFKKIFMKHDQSQSLKALKIRNAHDIVPMYPPFGYDNVGQELNIDTSLSPYLKNFMLSAHQMEVYLHGVAGGTGSQGEFVLVVARDIGLINKNGDWLKDEYPVPVGWWVQANKGMVQMPDGSWTLMDHELDE